MQGAKPKYRLLNKAKYISLLIDMQIDLVGINIRLMVFTMSLSVSNRKILKSFKSVKSPTPNCLVYGEACTKIN